VPGLEIVMLEEKVEDTVPGTKGNGPKLNGPPGPVAVSVTVPVGAAPPPATVTVNGSGLPATSLADPKVSVVAVFAFNTTCDRFAELPWRRMSPLYVAVIGFVPAGRSAVVSDAVQVVSNTMQAPTGTVPMVVAPSVKVTLPAGTTAPTPGLRIPTVAVNVTLCP
jgi:hypothetical protein